jgi:hypothetical protein
MGRQRTSNAAGKVSESAVCLFIGDRYACRVPQFKRSSMLLPFPHAINQFSAWLERTPASEAIAAHGWVVPVVQSIHIMAIATVAGSALMIDLRLLGSYAVEQPLKVVSTRFMPFVWWSLLVLLATGIIMIVGEPPRSLRNPIFQLKLFLILAAVVVTLACQFWIRTRSASVDTAARPSTAAAALAAASLVAWISVIFAGRWIAYFT